MTELLLAGPLRLLGEFNIGGETAVSLRRKNRAILAYLSERPVSRQQLVEARFAVLKEPVEAAFARLPRPQGRRDPVWQAAVPGIKRCRSRR